MPIQVLMPALSPTMEKGNLAKWLKKEGDTVKSGDVIAEIETDKATMEVEAVDEGTLGKILVAEGTEDVAVNTPIADHPGRRRRAPPIWASAGRRSGQGAEASAEVSKKSKSPRTASAKASRRSARRRAAAAAAAAGRARSRKCRKAPRWSR